jgi:hypothetical protein
MSMDPKRKAKPKRTKRHKRHKDQLTMISKKEYKSLIAARQHHHKLSLAQRKKLDEALLVNYCSCLKHVRGDKKVKKGLEYPICMSSVYKKRGFSYPKNAKKRCKTVKR